MRCSEQRGERPEDHRPRTYGGVEQQSGYAVASVPLGDEPEHSEPGKDRNNQNYNGFHLSLGELPGSIPFSEPDRGWRHLHQLVVIDERQTILEGHHRRRGQDYRVI